MVGALGDDSGGDQRGALYVLSLHPNATVMSEVKLSSTSGSGFPPNLLVNLDRFGCAVGVLSDLVSQDG
jgi:hypothetical protein